MGLSQSSSDKQDILWTLIFSQAVAFIVLSFLQTLASGVVGQPRSIDASPEHLFVIYCWQ
jgi:hypothetical protein